MKLGAILFVIALLVVSGCGKSAKQLATEASARASASAKASTDAAAAEKKAAGDRYLALVAPDNAALDEFSAEFDKERKANKANVPALAELCQKTADAEDAFIRGLTTGPWPAYAQKAVQDLIPDIAAEHQAEVSCARATTVADVVSALTDLGKVPAGKAELVRVALGLPGVK